MTTEDDFNAALDANPDDHHTRLVFADWLQERGDVRAEGYRALGTGRLRPHLFAHFFCWLDSNLVLLYGEPTRAAIESARAVLPDDWYALLPRQRNSAAAAQRTTRREAEDDAARAFAQLPPERRAELLVAPPADE